MTASKLCHADTILLTSCPCAVAQVAAHAGSWKQLYFERNLEDALEQWVLGQRGWQERLRRMLGDGAGSCVTAMCCRLLGQGLQHQDLRWRQQQRTAAYTWPRALSAALAI